MKLKHFVPVGIFVVMVAVFYVGLYRDPTLVPSPFIGKSTPTFDLPTLFNPEERMTHEEFKGQISLFNVWASWCPGCAAEHEMLNAIAAEGEVPIYGLNWKDEAPAAKKWLAQRGNPYAKVPVDRENITGIDWGVYGAPETFLIDANGVIQYKLIGPMTPEIWKEEFIPRIKAALSKQGGES